MSTKAIREALNELEEWRRDHGHDKGIARDALAEVEAIERAAKWMYEITDTSKVPHEEYERCCNTLYAIFQQAKAR